MKLIIQIPCYNEAGTLAITLAELPREVEGFDQVEWLVIDDGSTDETIRVARENGVDHIVRNTSNEGLARAFAKGIEACLQLGAGVIVNTDADNQYDARDIPALVGPILAGQADLVVGARPIDAIEHFSPVKKVLQKVGSWAVGSLSRAAIPDAASGFRALSRDAALQLVVFSEITIIRIFVIYRPFRFFAAIGSVLFATGFLLGIRFLYCFMTGSGEGHVQSLILASILLGMGFQNFLIAFVADLLAANRKLLQDVRFKIAKWDRLERNAERDQFASDITESGRR